MAGQTQTVYERHERVRELPTTDFSPNTNDAQDLFRDTSYRKLLIRLSGGFKNTYASGTPVANSFAAIASLIGRIDVTVDGRVVKAVHPYHLSQLQLLETGALGERKSSAAASVLDPPNPTADGFGFGTTTQIVTIAESVELCFMDRLATVDRDATVLDTRNAKTAQVRFFMNAFSSLQTANDTTSITYDTNTLKIDVMTVEAAHLTSAWDLRETFLTEPFSQQTNDRRVEIPVGNKLRGVSLVVRDGGAAKALSNNALTRIQVMRNGNDLVVNTTFHKVQARNRAQYGLNVAYASNVSRIDGFAFLDFLTDGRPDTALDLSQAKRCELLLSTAASGSGATYTNAVEAMIHIMEYHKWAR